MYVNVSSEKLQQTLKQKCIYYIDLLLYLKTHLLNWIIYYCVNVITSNKCCLETGEPKAIFIKPIDLYVKCDALTFVYFFNGCCF